MLEMDAELEQYILAHSEPEGEVLAELSRATHLNVLRPRMLSGNLQGQFLKMICRMIGARRVLEIGTYTGYAAISMAAGIYQRGEASSGGRHRLHRRAAPLGDDCFKNGGYIKRCRLRGQCQSPRA